MLGEMMGVCFKWETNNYENHVISVPLRKHKLVLNIKEEKKHNYTKERWTESLIPGKVKLMEHITEEFNLVPWSILKEIKDYKPLQTEPRIIFVLIYFYF